LSIFIATERAKRLERDKPNRINPAVKKLAASASNSLELFEPEIGEQPVKAKHALTSSVKNFDNQAPLKPIAKL
jgi:hypothetical protein